MFAKSSDAPILAVAASADEARALVAALGRRGDVVYVAASGSSESEFRRLGVEPVMLDRYQDLGRVACVNALSARVARGWWRLPGLEHVAAVVDDEMSGPLGQLLELPVYHVVADASRAVLTASALVDSVRPARVVTVLRRPVAADGGFWVGFTLDLSVVAVATVAESLGIPHESLAPAAPPAVSRRWVHLAARVSTSIRWRLTAPARRWRRRAWGRTPTAPVSTPPPGSALVYAEGRHVYPLLPVVRELAAARLLHPVVVDQDLAAGVREELEDSGIAVYAPGSADAGVAGLARRAADAWSADRAAPALAALGEVELGVPLWPLAGFQFEWLMLSGFAEIERRLAIAEATVAALRPAVLVTPVDTSVNDLVWILACRRRGIPVVTQLHGATYVEPNADLWGRGEADVTAVWGELTREWHLEATTRPAESFVSVGYPRFDELATVPQVDERVAAREALDVAAEPVVLLLTAMAGGAVGTYFRAEAAVYDLFFEALERIAGAVAVVRCHPASEPDTAAAAAARHDVRTVLDASGDLLPLLLAADVVVGQPTTALIEAMLVERPVVLWLAESADELSWWLRHGELRTARGPEELRRLVAELAAPGAARDAALADQAAFLRRLVGSCDGGAAARTAALVARVAFHGAGTSFGRR